jgi:glycine betaine/proline transport system substrate-binding protein
MKKLLISAAIVAGASFGMQGQANAACGEFQMSDMNWPSATLMANVDKIILEEGYGCKIELIPGATTATFATMNEKGEPHVAAEFWTNAVSVELEKAMDQRGVFILQSEVQSLNLAKAGGLPQEH